ncbi:hypothetical protein ACSHT2_08620 [Bradyrhizobium sp. PUT101]|uniref:hypothetical protein n=1 Tax=Bradyrhizobium sp. PUT101 TaxID=3447427 RepID=UPI003F86C23B
MIMAGQALQRQCRDVSKTCCFLTNTSGSVIRAALGGIVTVAVSLLWMKPFPSLRHVEHRE